MTCDSVITFSILTKQTNEKLFLDNKYLSSGGHDQPTFGTAAVL